MQSASAFVSEVAREHALYWDLDPATATQDDVITAAARYKIFHANPPGCGAFLVSEEDNKKMLALRRVKRAQVNTPLH